MRFFMQVNNVLIYVLLAAAVGKLLLGEWLDASVILGVVIINALLGFIQEGEGVGLDTEHAFCRSDGRARRKYPDDSC